MNQNEKNVEFHRRNRKKTFSTAFRSIVHIPNKRHIFFLIVRKRMTNDGTSTYYMTAICQYGTFSCLANTGSDYDFIIFYLTKFYMEQKTKDTQICRLQINKFFSFFSIFVHYAHCALRMLFCSSSIRDPINCSCHGLIVE